MKLKRNKVAIAIGAGIATLSLGAVLIQTRGAHTQSPPSQAPPGSAEENRAVWPSAANLAGVQAEAAAGKRPEMYDPGQVVESYLRIRLAGRSNSAESGNFGIGNFDPVGERQHAGELPFGGIGDLAQGSVSLQRHRLPDGSYTGIWYVLSAGTEGLGPLDDHRSYNGTDYKEEIAFFVDGTADALIQEVGKGQPIEKKTFKVDAPYSMLLDRSIPERVPVHVEIYLQASDGKLHFQEFLRTSYPPSS